MRSKYISYTIDLVQTLCQGDTEYFELYGFGLMCSLRSLVYGHVLYCSDLARLLSPETGRFMLQITLNYKTEFLNFNTVAAKRLMD